MSKVCTKCGIEKSLEDFGKDRSRRDGLKDRCKICRAKDGDKYRQNNKEDLAKRKAKYYQDNKKKIAKYRRNNKERIAAQRAQYRKDNIEMMRNRDRVRRSRKDVKAMAAKRYQNNRIEIAKRVAKYRKDNKIEVLEREAKYRRNNRVAFARRSNKYYKKNKGKVYALGAMRRALKINQTPLDANLKEIQFYYAVCSETNEILGSRFFHVDHIQPLSKGGLHHENNLQILDASLNLQKNDKWPLNESEQLIYKGIIL